MAGEYEKLHILGSGTYGKAWLALAKSSKKQCVLKEIKVSDMSKKEIDQTITEVTVLARCKHENIIRYTGAYVDSGCLFIAMEYAEAGDINKKIVDQRGIHFTENTILTWFVQINMALCYIHSHNILHRDLKPQNIFLTSENTIKLGDFGIARVLRDKNDLAMTVIGTPYYLSPEICQKQPYNHKSDMWALGCVLYELCCLRVPFSAPDFTSLVMTILSGSFDPIPRHYGPLLEDLVGVLLRTQPDSRPTSEQILLIPAMQPYVLDYTRNLNRVITEKKRRLASPNIEAFNSAKKEKRDDCCKKSVSGKMICKNLAKEKDEVSAENEVMDNSNPEANIKSEIQLDENQNEIKGQTTDKNKNLDCKSAAEEKANDGCCTPPPPPKNGCCTPPKNSFGTPPKNSFGTPPKNSFGTSPPKNSFCTPLPRNTRIMDFEKAMPVKTPPKLKTPDNCCAADDCYCNVNLKKLRNEHLSPHHKDVILQQRAAFSCAPGMKLNVGNVSSGPPPVFSLFHSVRRPATRSESGARIKMQPFSMALELMARKNTKTRSKSAMRSTSEEKKIVNSGSVDASNGSSLRKMSKSVDDLTKDQPEIPDAGAMKISDNSEESSSDKSPEKSVAQPIFKSPMKPINPIFKTPGRKSFTHSDRNHSNASVSSSGSMDSSFRTPKSSKTSPTNMNDSGCSEDDVFAASGTIFKDPTAITPAAGSQSSGGTCINSTTFRVPLDKPRLSVPIVDRREDCALNEQNVKILYQATLESIHCKNRALTTLTLYLQEKLGPAFFQHLYGLFKEAVASRMDHEILKCRMRKSSIYLPLFIEIMHIEENLAVASK